jgi:digeranylgeranylglycerophospholipid reductase
MYDIIVVGGNLSGLTAAINAAYKKTKVALIERHEKPFSPAHCGEAISHVTADFLNIEKRKCPKNEIREIIIDISKLKKFNLKIGENKIYIIDRNYLENNLIKEVEEKNIKTYFGRRVKKFNPPNEIIMDNDEKIYGKIIIDASGISCIIGKYIDINTELKPKDIGVCIQSRIKSNFDPKKMYMWWSEPFAPFGYAWLFPISNNLANIGLGILGGQNIDLNILLKNYIDKMINKEYKIITTFRACEPMVKPLENLVSNNIMFVGDSARLVDPASGAGIHNAVFSGTLAGLISSKYINGLIPSLDIYEKTMSSKMRRIKKTYMNKSKLDTTNKYEKAFNRLFTTIDMLNKIIPNFYQNRITKFLNKDVKKVDLFR